MAEAEAPRVGAWLPVLVEQVVNDTLVVTLRCGERRFAGVLLDCSKKYGGTGGVGTGTPPAGARREQSGAGDPGAAVSPRAAGRGLRGCGASARDPT